MPDRYAYPGVYVEEAPSGEKLKKLLAANRSPEAAS
jgi:hypothetical protein